MLFPGLHNVDYKEKKREVKPLLCKKREDIPEGTWLSFETIGFLTGVSKQTIYLAFLSEQIKAIKFPKGAMLANLDEVESKVNCQEIIRV